MKLANDLDDEGVPAIRQGPAILSGGKKSQYSLRFSTRQPWASADLRIFLKSPFALMSPGERARPARALSAEW